APTHLLLIARAETKLGLLVEAQEAYIKIQRDPLAPDAPPAFAEAHQKALEEQAVLAPRVPTLKVELDGGTTADVTVTLDGAPMAPALVGFAGPINPGRHIIEAKGARLASESTTVSISEGDKERVTLYLRPVAGAEAAPGDQPAAAAPGGAPAGPPPDEASSSPAMRIGGWVAIGVGGVGAVLGTVFLVKNRSDRGSANDLCTGNVCPESRRANIDSLDSSANSASTLSLVSYAVGGAAAATGVVLLLMSHGRPAAATTGATVPSPQARAEREFGPVTWTPWVDLRSAGVMGTF
ncbi:MAG TPA: hypothetical protein VKU41_00030, partial [Polyangiaceae bacterium]|nr:hypothetical protein [Polyangiaceae bacterium]